MHLHFLAFVINIAVKHALTVIHSQIRSFRRLIYAKRNTVNTEICSIKDLRKTLIHTMRDFPTSTKKYGDLQLAIKVGKLVRQNKLAMLYVTESQN